MIKSAVDIMEERSSTTLRAGAKFWTAGNVIVKGHRFLSKDLTVKSCNDTHEILSCNDYDTLNRK